MNNTGQKTNDNFKTDSLQLDCQEVMEIKGNPKKYSGIYKDLAELIGDAATVKIWRHFSGLNVSFPQKLYSKEYKRDYIRRNMEEMKPSDIAKSLGLTERRVRQIITDIKHKSDLNTT